MKIKKQMCVMFSVLMLFVLCFGGVAFESTAIAASCVDTDSCTATCDNMIENRSCLCQSNMYNECISTASCSCDENGTAVTSCTCETC